MKSNCPKCHKIGNLIHFAQSREMKDWSDYRTILCEYVCPSGHHWELKYLADNPPPFEFIGNDGEAVKNKLKPGYCRCPNCAKAIETGALSRDYHQKNCPGPGVVYSVENTRIPAVSREGAGIVIHFCESCGIHVGALMVAFPGKLYCGSCSHFEIEQPNQGGFENV